MNYQRCLPTITVARGGRENWALILFISNVRAARLLLVWMLGLSAFVSFLLLLLASSSQVCPVVKLGLL